MSGSERVKTDLRHSLTQEPVEQKIRKVGELIRLASVMKAQRAQEEASEIFPKPKTSCKRSVDRRL